MDVEQVLETLQRDPEIGPQITAWRIREGRPARYGPTPEWLDRRLRGALAELGIARLYIHQAEALGAAVRGEHVVVATGTASGKSLCYHLPVLQALLEHPRSTALYLYPTRALAHDQEAFLRALAGTIPLPPFGTYDGDTPPAVRPRLRREARLLLTNPDMLHAGILPRHPHWAPFLASLRYVVLDELHVYRGLFGSHVANVLRRLKRLCAFYGSRPQFLCASATIGNPGELAGRLVEEAVTVVDDDGAPRGRQHFLLYNPPLADPALGIRCDLLRETEKLAARFLEAGLPTVVFARTRLGMELLLIYLRERCSGRRGRLRGYRGGYRPEVRREIEAGLRGGTVEGVVSTNALELGVDIGTLAACIMAGYPATVAATWQQAGRAGRRESPSAAILVAGPGPLDQYLVTHPDDFFGRSPERAHINPDNPFLLVEHLRCALFELSFEADEPFGAARPAPLDERTGVVALHGANTIVSPYGRNPIAPFLDALADEGCALLAGRRYYWIGGERPAERLFLRTASADAVTIVDDSGEKLLVLGQLDRPGAATLLYPGAVYLHEGRFYRVERLDWEGGTAVVRPARPDYYTQADLEVDWEVVLEAETAPQGQGRRHHGAVRVQVRSTSYRRVRLYTHETLGRGTIELPPQEFLTQAFWMTLPEPAHEIVRPDYGPNWPEMRLRARRRDRFTCQHCGVHESQTGREHDVHHRIPFRRFGPGEYLQANDLSNLVTLCRSCHARVDHGPRESTVAALQGLGLLLLHVAPLFLACDPGDIQVSTRLRMPPEGLPVLLIYDNCPGGAGLSPHLFEACSEWLQAGRSRLRECPCPAGCPSCIGPAEEGEEGVKEPVGRLLELLV